MERGGTAPATTLLPAAMRGGEDGGDAGGDAGGDGWRRPPWPTGGEPPPSRRGRRAGLTTLSAPAGAAGEAGRPRAKGPGDKGRAERWVDPRRIVAAPGGEGQQRGKAGKERGRRGQSRHQGAAPHRGNNGAQRGAVHTGQQLQRRHPSRQAKGANDSRGWRQGRRGTHRCGGRRTSRQEGRQVCAGRAASGARPASDVAPQNAYAPTARCDPAHAPHGVPRHCKCKKKQKKAHTKPHLQAQ